MNFGQAIEMMKAGRRMRRAGWNGKNMSIMLQHGATKALSSERLDLIGGVRSDLFEYDPNARTNILPHLIMITPDGSHVVGWLASQTDILAEDWEMLAS